MKFKKKIKNANIYLALFICLAAVAVGAAVSLPVQNTSGTPEEADFERITVVWSESATEPETHGVDVRITGIGDERTTLTTAAEAEENLPFKGEFALPMGTHILKDYSNGEMVESKTTGDWRVHNGIDFGGTKGNDVNAAADGKIISVTADPFMGTVVEIDHGNSMVIRYCGLAENSALPEGSRIEKGDRIGALGAVPIESGDGDHLHLEVLVDGKYADPLAALNKTGLRKIAQ